MGRGNGRGENEETKNNPDREYDGYVNPLGNSKSKDTMSVANEITLLCFFGS